MIYDNYDQLHFHLCIYSVIEGASFIPRALGLLSSAHRGRPKSPLVPEKSKAAIILSPNHFYPHRVTEWIIKTALNA